MQKLDYHWRRAVNIPAWVVQLCICIYLIGSGSVVIAAIKSPEVEDTVDQIQDGSQSLDIFTIIAGAYIGLGSITTIFVILEIIFCTRKTMKPAIYLTIAVLKTLLWLTVFIIIVLSGDGLAIFLALTVLITCIVQLSYGATVVHKARKGTLNRGKHAVAVVGHVEGGLYNPLVAAAPAPTEYGYAASTNTKYKSSAPSPAPQQQYGYAPPAAAQPYYSPNSYGQQPPAGTCEMQDRPHH